MLREHVARFMRQIPRRRLRFEVHLVEHCNLNCWGCSHFSPLAREAFTDLAAFERDMARLSHVFDAKAEFITLLGGEPLLHPQVDLFLRTVRQYFPNTTLNLVTNGLLLPRMKQEFWDACRQSGARLKITRYPVNADWEGMLQIARSYGVNAEFYGGTDIEVKTFRHNPLDPSGRQNARWNFRHCQLANTCIMLKKGRLFTCGCPPNIEHFNEYFGMNLPCTDADSIDVYQADAPEILRFLAKPIPFCAYCDVKRRTVNHPWKTSAKDISEWTRLALE